MKYPQFKFPANSDFSNAFNVKIYVNQFVTSFYAYLIWNSLPHPSIMIITISILRTIIVMILNNPDLHNNYKMHIAHNQTS